MIKEKILVVDDDPDISMMIKMILEYHGYAVSVTDRADTAEKILPKEQFDLVIMDMLLSGVNGVDICMRIKQDQQFAKLPIIMISAHPNARSLCLEAGADDFLAKPFDMEEMLTAIKRHV